MILLATTSCYLTEGKCIINIHFQELGGGGRLSDCDMNSLKTKFKQALRKGMMEQYVCVGV